MSHNPTAAAKQVDAPTTTPAGAVRGAVVAIAALAGLTGNGLFGIWHHSWGPEDQLPYDVFAPIREEWWAWHLFAALATILGMVALAIAACVLVSRRGAGLATAGAVATVLGALSWSSGIAGEAAVFGYAGDPKALPSADTRAAFLMYVHHTDNNRYSLPIIAGIVLYSIGFILIAIALWRAGSVPRWVPVALVAGTVLNAAVPWGLMWSLLRLIANVGGVAIGWYAWRHTARRGPEARAPRTPPRRT